MLFRCLSSCPVGVMYKCVGGEFTGTCVWKAVRWEEACEGVGFFMESGVKSGVIGTWDKG